VSVCAEQIEASKSIYTLVTAHGRAERIGSCAKSVMEDGGSERGWISILYRSVAVQSLLDRSVLHLY
jgi:hypothetical protein